MLNFRVFTKKRERGGLICSFIEKGPRSLLNKVTNKRELAVWKKKEWVSHPHLSWDIFEIFDVTLVNESLPFSQNYGSVE